MLVVKLHYFPDCLLHAPVPGDVLAASTSGACVQLWLADWPFLQVKICMGAAIGSKQTGHSGMSFDCCCFEEEPTPVSRSIFFHTPSPEIPQAGFFSQQFLVLAVLVMLH